MNIEERMEQLRQTAKEYAVAHGERRRIEEAKKPTLALLMKEAEKNGHRTIAAQEREALADPSYMTLINGLAVAEERAEKLRWELKIAEIGFETWRTMESSKRAERKGYGA